MNSENGNNSKFNLKLGSEVLQSLFENGKSPLSEQFLRWKLWMKWGEIVGPTIAQHTEPVGYYRGTLYVWVKSSSWIQQLHFLKGQIAKNINDKVGMQYVQQLRFTLDRKAVPQGSQQTELREAISKIAPSGDDDL